MRPATPWQQIPSDVQVEILLQCPLFHKEVMSLSSASELREHDYYWRKRVEQYFSDAPELLNKKELITRDRFFEIAGREYRGLEPRQVQIINAIKENDLEWLKKLNFNLDDLFFLDEFKGSPCYWIRRLDRSDISDYIYTMALEKSQNADSYDGNKMISRHGNLLHFAAMLGRPITEVQYAFLAGAGAGVGVGADVNAMSETGITALCYATMGGMQDIVDEKTVEVSLRKQAKDNADETVGYLRDNGAKSTTAGPKTMLNPFSVSILYHKEANILNKLNARNRTHIPYAPMIPAINRIISERVCDWRLKRLVAWLVKTQGTKAKLLRDWMIKAINANATEFVREMASRCPSLLNTYIEESGYSNNLLNVAIEMKKANPELVRLLMRPELMNAYCDRYRNPYRKTVLHAAIINKSDPKVIRELLKNGATFQIDEFGFYAFSRLPWNAFITHNEADIKYVTSVVEMVLDSKALDQRAFEELIKLCDKYGAEELKTLLKERATLYLLELHLGWVSQEIQKHPNNTSLIKQAEVLCLLINACKFARDPSLRNENVRRHLKEALESFQKTKIRFFSPSEKDFVIECIDEQCFNDTSAERARKEAADQQHNEFMAQVTVGSLPS